MKKRICFLLCGVMLLAGCSATALSAVATTAATTTSTTNIPMTITVFNAGKADAILFSTSEGYVLMDTGLDGDKDNLVKHLQDRNVTKLAALIITHFDKDHVGGADAIIENFSVDQIYTTYVTSSNDELLDFQTALKEKGLKMTPVYETTMMLDSAIFEINGATDNYSEKTDNNSSLITMVTYGTQKYLFMGDAMDERIEQYLTSHDANADFLKVPYHGYFQNNLHTLFSAVTPTAAAITNSKKNLGSSELRKTESLLKDIGATVYETVNGNITVTCTSAGFTVTQ